MAATFRKVEIVLAAEPRKIRCDSRNIGCNAIPLAAKIVIPLIETVLAVGVLEAKQIEDAMVDGKRGILSETL